MVHNDCCPQNDMCGNEEYDSRITPFFAVARALQGEDGVGISGIELRNNHLYVTLTNARVIDAGEIDVVSEEDLQDIVAMINAIEDTAINGKKIGDGNITLYATDIQMKNGLYNQHDLEAVILAMNEVHLNGLQNKQDILVSSENIKTINGQSILGSGDITIGGIEGYTPDFTLADIRYIVQSGSQMQADISSVADAVYEGKMIFLQPSHNEYGFLPVSAWLDEDLYLYLMVNDNQLLGTTYLLKVHSSRLDFNVEDITVTNVNTGSLIIDSELSATSENAVQNKVVTNAINEVRGIAEGAKTTAEQASQDVDALEEQVEGISLGGFVWQEQS